MMYIVRFTRRDGKQDEDYYYCDIKYALEHISLYKSDDSNLYTSILLMEADTLQVVDSIVF